MLDLWVVDKRQPQAPDAVARGDLVEEDRNSLITYWSFGRSMPAGVPALPAKNQGKKKTRLISRVF
jgi:hypothetical protein